MHRLTYYGNYALRAVLYRQLVQTYHWLVEIYSNDDLKLLHYKRLLGHYTDRLELTLDMLKRGDY